MGNSLPMLFLSERFLLIRMWFFIIERNKNMGAKSKLTVPERRKIVLSLIRTGHWYQKMAAIRWRPMMFMWTEKLSRYQNGRAGLRGLKPSWMRWWQKRQHETDEFWKRGYNPTGLSRSACGGQVPTSFCEAHSHPSVDPSDTALDPSANKH